MTPEHEAPNRGPSNDVGSEVRTPHAAVLAASLDPVVTMDSLGRIVGFNAAAEQTFGYARSDVIGRDMADLIIPARLRDAHRRGLARYLETGEGPVLGRRLEISALRSNGDEFPVELAIVPLPGISPPMFTGFIRDLSQHRSPDEALRALAESNAAARVDAEQAREEAQRLAAELQRNAAELEQQTRQARTLAEQLEQANAHLAREYTLLRTILASTDDLVFAKDLEGRYVLMNDAGARLHGRPIEDFIGRTDEELFAPALATELRANDLEVIRSGEMRRFQESTILQGERRTYRSTKTVYRHSAGAIAGIVGISTDITDAARADAERSSLLERERATRMEAERANRAKGDFLAVMSHELRTPLNAIAGYVQILEMGLHGPLTDAQKETLRRVDRSQRHLLALINDILNFVRIEAGRIHYAVDDVVLQDVLTDLSALIQPQLQAKHLAYEVRLHQPSIAVRADRDKLRQVLLNLLSNAIKFTPAGGRITVDAEERRSMPDTVFVRVTDTGSGIPRDKLEVIFEPFVRIDTNLTRTTEGTGLGLAISRDLARGMGGNLRARSEVGRGSTFTVTLARGAAPIQG